VARAVSAVASNSSVAARDLPSDVGVAGFVDARCDQGVMTGQRSKKFAPAACGGKAPGKLRR
jgi:hypothetical protein